MPMLMTHRLITFLAQIASYLPRELERRDN